ncbi:MAG TPA: PilZ domain-containing protein [Terriglobales bacterium]|nr:PilZ domain-containing protein [Terriglobales bacterium]
MPDGSEPRIPEPRIKIELAVRVWGMNKEGKPFFQNAEAGNISSEGALLSGLEQQLTAGDMIGVQYRDKKARFRVIWVMDGGAAHKIQAGIQMLEGQQCPWREELNRQPVAAAPADDPTTPANKRKFVRLKVHTPIDLRDEGSLHLQTNATDMSGRGCYVETLIAIPVGTPVNVTFWLHEEKVATTAIVRASDAGVGMGIEFIGLDEEKQTNLQHSLEESSSGITGPDSGRS